ncbi:MAG: cysteine--tRNA ligase [Candidatus Levybacteria bacterium]|nr:cysteine--tRNA ligase [Candidatus Levybacteria bacterium]
MLKIYNTLSRSVEPFEPIKPPQVGMYSCGPTVYDYQHIGHMRRYVGDDILIRVLKANNFEVHHVMNITDVGHLTSDADTGEDKMEKGAKKFGMSVWDIAKKFEAQFKDSCKALNIGLPKDLMHATDYIKEQIELVLKLEEKGFSYKATDGIYFDTSKFADYFKLSRQNPDELRGGVRIELGEKKNISDFALWKFSYPKGRSQRPAQDDPTTRRQMEWESPWGVGFPGWHIECSAMSMKALGDSFDIHTGGVDHINIHHTNEIAQAQAASGKPFVKYWVHHAFLIVEGEKMSKSLGNTYTVQDVSDKGFDPMALRYLYLQTNYRQEMNFTWEALEGAQTALNKLRSEFISWEEAKIGCAEFEERFLGAVSDDLNMPKALSIVWEMIGSDYPGSAKKRSLLKMDEVLGLNLSQFKPEKIEVPSEVQKLIEKRDELRKAGEFSEADAVRQQIKEKGFIVEDLEKGVKIRKS